MKFPTLTLTGLNMAVYLQLRTKVSVDPAGLSLPQVSLNHGPTSEVAKLIYLSNNSLIALSLLTMAAMEDGLLVLLTMLRLTVSPVKKNIPTLPKTELANSREDPLK